MDNDNIYPVSTQHFFPTVQKANQAVDEEELQKTLDQLPVLKEVVGHLDKQIEFLGSLESIPVDLAADPLTFQKQHAANSLAKAKLELERSFILSKVQDVSKRRT